MTMQEELLTQDESEEALSVMTSVLLILFESLDKLESGELFIPALHQSWPNIILALGERGRVLTGRNFDSDINSLVDSKTLFRGKPVGRHRVGLFLTPDRVRELKNPPFAELKKLAHGKIVEIYSSELIGTSPSH
jgi:hypothetical protein